MNENTLIQALEKVDMDALCYGERLIKNLREIKEHHQSIKFIMWRDAYEKMSKDDIANVTSLLSLFTQLIDPKSKSGRKTGPSE